MPFDYVADPEDEDDERLGPGRLQPGRNAVGISRYKRMKDARDRWRRQAEDWAEQNAELYSQLMRTEADLVEARRTIADLKHGEPL